MSLSTWIAFFIAAVIVCVSPDPGALSSMSCGMRHGWRHGMWNVLGLQVAILVNIAVLALGLGALLLASTTAFEILKWGGVLYLLYLGVMKWREQPAPFDAPAAARADRSDGTARGIFVQGLLVNLTNPKGLVFLLAVVPQFIDPQQPQVMQYIVLAITMVTVDSLVMTGYTGLAARVLRLLRDANHIRWVNRALGSFYAGAGVALAAFKRAG
jgi:homoserine/homoserine lactone efflux protein